MCCGCIVVVVAVSRKHVCVEVKDDGEVMADFNPDDKTRYVIECGGQSQKSSSARWLNIVDGIWMPLMA